METEEAEEEKKDFVEGSAKVLSSIARFAVCSPVTMLLVVLHSTQCNIDSLKFSIKEISNCKMIAETYMAQKALKD